MTLTLEAVHRLMHPRVLVALYHPEHFPLAISDFVLAGSKPVLVHNECTDAAYQGALHIQEEVARGNLGHVIPDVDMNDAEAIGHYIDGFISTPGRETVDGGVAWFDHSKGVIIIQRSEWSTTAYQATYDYFLRKTGG